jgi:hypothetical protein
MILSVLIEVRKKTIEHQKFHNVFANHHWKLFHFNRHLVLE